MTAPYEIEEVYLDGDTRMFGGIRWVVRYKKGGTRVYPGSWTECTVREYASMGLRYNEPRRK